MFLTITMTDHRPIKINIDNWHCITQNIEFSEYGNHHWEIWVRESLDKTQYIVHGKHTCTNRDFPSEERHGFLVDDIDKVPQAIKKIQNLIKATPDLAHFCISRLPKKKKDNWHIIAENVEHSKDGSDTWEIKVGESLDKTQYIVQGMHSCNHPEFPSEERHELLVDDIDKVPQAIKNIQNLIKATPKLAHVCISYLPALSL